jgi:superoxide dismutase
MAYTLPPLPYALDALVPHIDAKTMEIHHGKHHQAYITNATNLLKDHADLAALEVNALIADLSKVPEAIRGGVRNNAGGHSNHAFFWTIMGPGKGGAPKGTLAAAIEAQLGGFAKFKEDFAKAGYTTLSGWSYKSQWWVSHNEHGAYAARGVHGQAIYIDPKAEMVIARFASNPQASNLRFDDISLPAYQAIAERLMAKK